MEPYPARPWGTPIAPALGRYAERYSIQIFNNSYLDDPILKQFFQNPKPFLSMNENELLPNVLALQTGVQIFNCLVIIYHIMVLYQHKMILILY
eukprot:UN09671